MATIKGDGVDALVKALRRIVLITEAAQKFPPTDKAYSRAQVAAIRDALNAARDTLAFVGDTEPASSPDNQEVKP